MTERRAESSKMTSQEIWQEQPAAGLSLKQLLLSGQARAELVMPQRGNAKHRDVQSLVRRASA